MSNTHHISLVAAAAVLFSFAAQAAAQTQVISVSTPADVASAMQVEGAASVAPPLSLTQAYVPTDAPAHAAPLQLLVDEDQPTAAPAAPVAQVMENADDISGPAINALGNGHLALTVSQPARPAR